MRGAGPGGTSLPALQSVGMTEADAVGVGSQAPFTASQRSPQRSR